MERILEETWGNGFVQYRTLVLYTFPLLSCAGLYQLPMFFGQNLPHLCAENGTVLEVYSEENRNDTCGESCSMRSSYSHDLGMICDKAHLRQYVLTYIMWSSCFGALITGNLMDTLGRRKAILLSGFGTFLSQVGIAISKSYFSFTLSTIGLGFFVTGLGQYTLPVELMPPQKRWLAGVWTTQCWSLGTGLLTLTTYLVRDWRMALCIYSTPFLSVLLFPFFIPESPRWLIRQRRLDDAIEIMSKIARSNGVKIERDEIRDAFTPLVKEAEAKDIKETSLTDVIISMTKYPRVSARLAILCLTNMIGLITWYLMIFRVGYIHCCIYVSYLIFFIMEGIIRFGVGGALMTKIRRKGVYFCISGGAILFLLTVVLKEMDDGSLSMARLVSGVAAKFVITMYFQFQNSVVAETNPTPVRQRVMSIQGAFGCIGSAVAPILVFSMPFSDWIIPFAAIILSSLVFLIPPIINRKLPETFDEASRLNEGESTCCSI